MEDIVPEEEESVPENEGDELNLKSLVLVNAIPLHIPFSWSILIEHLELGDMNPETPEDPETQQHVSQTRELQKRECICFRGEEN